MELLSNKELTALEISAELGIPKKNLWSYLNTLVKDKRIERINVKKPYIYRAITPKAYLKQLYYLMGDLMEVKPDKINDFIQKETLITKIKEIID